MGNAEIWKPSCVAADICANAAVRQVFLITSAVNADDGKLDANRSFNGSLLIPTTMPATLDLLQWDAASIQPLSASVCVVTPTFRAFD